MKKTLTMAVATLIVGAVTASAAITASVTTDDTGLYQATGVWDITAGPVAWQAIPNLAPVNWAADVTGVITDIGGGLNLYTIVVRGNHQVPNPPLAGTGSLGIALLNVLNAEGNASMSLPHNGGVDNWYLWAKIDPAGTLNFRVDANHPIPEPGSFALIAGLGLVGFAAYRRTRA